MSETAMFRQLRKIVLGLLTVRSLVEPSPLTRSPGRGNRGRGFDVLDDLGDRAAETVWFGYIEVARVKRAEHVSDLIESGNGSRKRIFSIKKGVREPDKEEEGIAMLGGRYRFPVGAHREDKAIADEDDG